MRLRLVTVAILLAVASRGYGRPSHPDPLHGITQERRSGSADSRYTMTLRSQPTSSRRRDISITNVKFDSRSKWLGRSMLPRLSLDDNARKNYLPVGALSSVSRAADTLSSRGNGRSTGKSPMTIPFDLSPRLSTALPIPVSIPTRRTRISSSKSLPREQARSSSLSLPLPIPIPVSIADAQMPRAQRKMSSSRNLVKIIPQRLRPNNYVRRNLTSKPVVDLHLKNWPNEVVQNVEDLFNYEKYTSFYNQQNNDDDNNKISTEILTLPNHREPAIKSPATQQVLWSKMPVVQDTPSTDDFKTHPTTNFDNLLGDLAKKKIHSPHLASSQVSQNTVVHIMNAGSRKPNVTVVEPIVAPNRTKTASTRPPQNVHIMFMSDKDANQTNGKPMKPVEITGANSNCPTIMINSITQINNTIESKEGCTDLNIVINSHVLNTQIFKPGANGQNVPPAGTLDNVKDPYGQVSDSPLNNYQTNRPLNNYNPNGNHNPYVDDPSNPNSNYNTNNNYNPNGNSNPNNNPYTSNNNYNPNSNYNSNNNYNPNNNPNNYNPNDNSNPNNNPYNSNNNYNPNSNYNSNNNYNPNSNPNNYNPNYGEANKNPGNQLLSDTDASQSFSQPGTQVSTFEVFQNTHINIGGNGLQADVLNDIEDDSGSIASDDSAATDVDGTPLADPNEETLDITGTQGNNDAAAAAPSETGIASSDATQGLSETAASSADVGSPQSNDSPGSASLPSLPNLPNLPRPGQLSDIANNIGGNGGSGSGSSSVADDDYDDFDLLEAISPVNLLDSISSVFDSFSGLNPVNYGILGMAVAPFVAFAAGIMGVAAFIFPWAFPGVVVARSWDKPNAYVRLHSNPMIRDVVHSSIHEYKHLNEWKGRRRRRKRKR